MAEIGIATIESSAGGVICRGAGETLELLLIQDGYGNWGWPKGHVETGETAEAAALRECREETGLTRLTAIAAVGTTDWYFRRAKTLVHKFCDYFLLRAGPAEEARPRHAEGIRACTWLTPRAAAGRLTYDNARRVLEASLERLEALDSADRRASPPPSRSPAGPHGK